VAELIQTVTNNAKLAFQSGKLAVQPHITTIINSSILSVIFNKILVDSDHYFRTLAIVQQFI